MRIAAVFALVAAIQSAAEAKVRFVRDVKPILETHCVRCHGANGAMKGLRLDSRERALMVVVKKNPEQSRIYGAARAGIMPPGPRKLTPSEIETLRRWIAEGATWPKNLRLTDTSR